jgi:hypothetical protein
MRRFAAYALALSFVASGSALADQASQTDKNRSKQARTPVVMTDGQMDNVTGGALINATLVDVVDVRNIQVVVPVNASVAVGVLGNAVSGALQQPGRVIQ